MSEDIRWVVSSSCATGSNCVEVGFLSGDTVGIRDTKDRGGSVLIFTANEWAAFLAGARAGEFDRLPD
jgi:hypothetical protein